MVWFRSDDALTVGWRMDGRKDWQRDYQIAKAYGRVVDKLVVQSAIPIWLLWIRTQMKIVWLLTHLRSSIQ